MCYHEQTGYKACGLSRFTSQGTSFTLRCGLALVFQFVTMLSARWMPGYALKRGKRMTQHTQHWQRTCLQLGC